MTDCGNFPLELQQLGLWISALPPDSGTLIFKLNDIVSGSRVTWRHESYSPCPGGICMRVLEALAPAAVHSPWISPMFSSGLCPTIHSRLQLSLLLVHLFMPHYFLTFRLPSKWLECRTLRAGSLFSRDLLCFTLLVQDVSDRLLDNCLVSSLPHDHVAIEGFRKLQGRWIKTPEFSIEIFFATLIIIIAFLSMSLYSHIEKNGFFEWMLGYYWTVNKSKKIL